MSETTEYKNLTPQEASALIKIIARDMEYSEEQRAMLDYYRREQWAIEREARKLTSQMVQIFFVLVLIQSLLMVWSARILYQRVDCIERVLLQMQEIQLMQPKTHPSNTNNLQTSPEVQNDVALRLELQQRHKSAFVSGQRQFHTLNQRLFLTPLSLPILPNTYCIW